MTITIHFCKDKAGETRFNAVADNGEKLLQSEGYKRPIDAHTTVANSSCHRTTS